MDISGYVLFTGEPHLVIFTENGFSNKEISEVMFGSCSMDPGEESISKSYSSWIVHFIGTTINRTYASFFPVGININFVRIVDGHQSIEYRCFERGINHETLACGSGAVAVSQVACELGLLVDDQVVVRPHRCRWHRPTAEFNVKRNGDDWYLFGSPEYLFEGEISFNASISYRQT